MESNHEIVLSDSSIITKLKDMRNSYSAQTQTFKSSDGSQRKWAKESSLVNRSNVIYIDETAFYEGDVTHKKWVSASEDIQLKEQELTLNAMCLAWFTSQEF